MWLFERQLDIYMRHGVYEGARIVLVLILLQGTQVEPYLISK